MTFNSLIYAAFLIIVVILYWALPSKFRNAHLLVASYVFYGTWDYRFLGLLAFSTIADYLIGVALWRRDEERLRKALLLASVAINLTILGFFKYFNFFVESFGGLLERMGLTLDPAFLQVILPIGVSFYSFKAISYTFDVYRRDTEPCRDLITFAVYVAYFPQLVAGPIERSRTLLPQLTKERPRPDQGQIESALLLILLGLVHYYRKWPGGRPQRN